MKLSNLLAKGYLGLFDRLLPSLYGLIILLLPAFMSSRDLATYMLLYFSFFTIIYSILDSLFYQGLIIFSVRQTSVKDYYPISDS